MAELTFNEYQRLARRTQNNALKTIEKRYHALHGMSAEVGEIHGIYQKNYQGHIFNPAELLKEVGDLLWMIAEFCDSYGITMEDVANMNIDKLEKRYPEGFDVGRSLNRDKFEVYGEDC